MNLGQRIKALRESQGLTQGTLAQRVSEIMARKGIKGGITQQALDKVEQGETKQPRRLEEIAEALGTSARALMFGEDTPKPMRPKELEISEAIKDLDDDDLEETLNLIIKARKAKLLDRMMRETPPPNNSGPDVSAA